MFGIVGLTLVQEVNDKTTLTALQKVRNAILSAGKVDDDVEEVPVDDQPVAAAHEAQSETEASEAYESANEDVE